MKRFSLTIFLFLFFKFLLPAQQVWYFGNGAGLDFSSGSCQPVFGGKLFTLEGCATATDDKGKLLFYTDGITVWNRYHKEMQNGNGLDGSQSSTQAALIVPQPGTKGIYFLFTTDEKGGKKGLCYSVIDMSSEAGVVIKKNIQLMALSTEKLAVAQEEKGKGFWVLSHQWNSNNFYVFPVTAQGVGKPVISSIGFPHAETGAGENREAIGSLCVSPNEKKIALAVCYRAKNNLEIFDFNNLTGKVSNAFATTLNGSPYGLAFSPDNTKLYVSFLKGKSGVVQLGMNEKTPVEIIKSKKDNSFGSLRLGPDGKIYIARSEDFLDIIQDPDKDGIACKYISEAVDLSPATSNFGLPNVSPLLIPSSHLSSSSASSPLSSSSPSLPSSSLSSSSPSSPSSSSPPSSSVSSSTAFSPPSNVSSRSQLAADVPSKPAASSHSTSFDCRKVIEKPFTTMNQMVMTDIAICESDYILSAKNFGASFIWSTMETTQKIKIQASGVYRVEVSKEGCKLTDSVRIHFRKEDAVFTFLPSFNPESGSFNSEFYYDIDDVQAFDMKVFDKHKNVLFETTNVKQKWNGKNGRGNIVSAGEYMWLVKYKPNCPKDSKVIVQEGKVLVKRQKK